MSLVYSCEPERNLTSYNCYQIVRTVSQQDWWLKHVESPDISLETFLASMFFTNHFTILNVVIVALNRRHNHSPFRS